MSKRLWQFIIPICVLVAACTAPATSLPTGVVASDTPRPPTASATLTPASSDTPTPTGTAVPEATLPAVPSGMKVERLDPVQYGVRLAAPFTNIRTEPSTAASIVGKLECSAEPVALDATAGGDASGLTWYHVASGGWVRADVIKVYAEASTAAQAAKSANCVAATQPSTAGDFTPTVSSVWDFVQSPDNMTGTCSNGPLLPPYGRVQITPSGAKLIWRSQEPYPYTFSRVGANLYHYSGPSALGDGTVTMTLTFTSATTLQMSRSFVPSSDPGCQHNYSYTGTFLWALP